ncbi:LPS translocon maturation chaperone LptM [Lutibaculum baratangense]|uniref:Uncharacterized protein n=1 Tax=Lutibaculum baratangense AMV1 TaxID=631454 RepID=V4RJY1_9HYPH|nr:lipoprotein [Lutibaculum baratangense]ESR26371.1 hypothetical protein N177_0871 [Lutibaculum baratangense AMV1]
MNRDWGRVPGLPRLAAVGLLALCLGLTACGRKGDLEPPPQANPEDVRVYEERPVPPPDGQRPSRPFVLDGLLL